MSTPSEPLRLRALFFDVFGTAVDWRSTVVDTLKSRAETAVSSRSTSCPDLHERLTQMDWSQFAEAWRMSYVRLTRGLDRKEGETKQPYKTVDQHYYDSLIALLEQYKLGDLFSVDEVEDVSKVWHKLAGWPDASAGVQELNDMGFLTCTLSNGNIALLQDMATFAKLPWTHIFSSEHFQAYKPSKEVYLGAVHKLGLEPEECAMVAAHLTDLWHAKKYGLKTVYVERELEEGWDAGRVRKAEEDNWADIWIRLNDGKVDQRGFLQLAKVLANRKAALT